MRRSSRGERRANAERHSTVKRIEIPRAPVLLALLCMAAVMAVLRLHTWNEPLERDMTDYALIGQGLYEGRPLYADLWDHKPPAIYVTYFLMQLVTGMGLGQIYALGLLAAIITMCAVYATASHGHGPRVGLLAAALWTVYSGEMLLQANQPNSEVFINACLIGGLAVLLRLRPRAGVSSTPLLALLFALAMLYKHTCVVYPVGFAAVHVLTAEPGQRGRALRQMITMLLLMAVIGLLVLVWFVQHGTFDDLWDAVVVYNMHYAGSVVTNLRLGLHPILLFPPVLVPTWPLFATCGAGLIVLAARRRAPSREAWLLLVYGLCNAFFIASPGRFFGHYYQVWLPLLAVGAAETMAAIASRAARPQRALAFLSTALVVAACALVLPEYRLDPVQWSREKYGEEFIAGPPLGRAIGGLLRPDETFYEMGAETGLYFYSGHLSPSGIMFNYGLVGPLAPKLSRRLVADLSRRLPDLLVVRLEHGLPPDHPVLLWLARQYGRLEGARPGDDRGARLDATGAYLLIPRPGSDLQGRMRKGEVPLSL